MKYTIPLFLLLFPMFVTAQSTDLSGLISNVDGKIVQDLEVRLLDDQGQLIATQFTDAGRFIFEGLPSGYDYTLQFDKAGAPLNGLSTLDMVLMSRHLIGVAPLDSELKVRAADIDGNGQISISDVLYLRQLVLAIIVELPHQRNWLFVAEDDTAPNTVQSTSFTYTVTGATMEKNFTIQKVGDLNSTATYH